MWILSAQTVWIYCLGYNCQPLATTVNEYTITTSMIVSKEWQFDEMSRIIVVFNLYISTVITCHVIGIHQVQSSFRFFF